MPSHVSTSGRHAKPASAGWSLAGRPVVGRLGLLLVLLLGVARPLAAADQAKVVVVFGDSITAGSGKVPDKKWASLVEARAHGALRVVNEGKGGRPTDSVGEFQEMVKRNAQVDLLVIALGMNDSRDISGSCVANAQRNVEQMVRIARTAYGARLAVLLVGPTNINKEALKESKPIAEPREANLKALNVAYRELAAKEGCEFVSTFGVVPEATLTADGVHPSAPGHEELAKVMLPAIMKAVGIKADQAQGAAAEAAVTPVAAAAPAGVEIRLWDGPAPNVPANPAAESVDKDGRTKNVSVPTLTAYLPERKLANGTAIIMCSGGGYTQLNLPLYAKLGCEAFLPRGIAVFNLKYRLSPVSRNPRIDATADGSRAVQLVRSRAAEWGIDPRRVGLVGASAGANMLLNLVSTATDGQPAAGDPLARLGSRPDFVVLLSSWPSNQTIADFRFPKETAIYLLHAEDDQVAKVAFARQIEAAATQAGVAIQARYVPTGGHTAFGDLHNLNGPGDWTTGFLAWLEGRGLVAPAR